MSVEHNLVVRRGRRERGIGPKALRDEELDFNSLLRATRFPSAAALGKELGFSGSGLMLAKRRGLTIWMADKCAIRFGFHPQEVWGRRWYEASARHDVLYGELLEAG